MTNYGYPRTSAESVGHTTTTGRHAVLADGDLSSFPRSGVAANSEICEPDGEWVVDR
jgi:hypothetical protein